MFEIPQDVTNGLKAVCKSGRSNMCHYGEVARLAEELGFSRAAEWVRNKTNHAAYARWVWGR